jgi:hypothetical protein
MNNQLRLHNDMFSSNAARGCCLRMDVGKTEYPIVDISALLFRVEYLEAGFFVQNAGFFI